MHSTPATDPPPTVRVWDLPTRLFHWLLVVCVVGLVVTGNMGGDMMTWHARFGFAVLTLVLFRLTWGFWGGYWSRFQRFQLQIASGMVADDEISFTGPFSQWVSGQSVTWATWYHKAVGKKLLLLWFGLHMLAMVFHRWRFGENLVTAMFSGDKVFPFEATASQDRAVHRFRALLTLVVCAGLVFWLVNLPMPGSP